MNKYIYYIILLLVVGALAVMLFTGDNKKKKNLDQRITLRKEDKIPYGAYIAHENLKHIFPKASISDNKERPGYWDSLSNYESDQALIIISPKFYADEFEMKTIIRFLENGNTVFISARNISSEAEEILRNRSSITNTASDFLDEEGNKITDSLAVRLFDPPFNENRQFSYKGAKYNAFFYELDTTIADVLGSDEMKKANFIHLKSGKGDLYFHLAPLTFSNYFLLQGNNMAYYENALSVISPAVKKVVWDEYYVAKESLYRSPDSDDSSSDNGNFLSELFKYKELKWALLTAILGLVLYVLLEMRRKQRYIPVIARHRNESLDFVKTIGRLYYDKGDHRNLCRKMAAYFLEHVRSKYKLTTGNLDDEFVRKLQFKTGCEESEIKEIVSFITYLDHAGNVSNSQLIQFHKQLESFYKKA